MNAKALPALIAFNVMLLLALVITSLTPAPTQGQMMGGANYIMVSGAVVGRDGQNVVYIIELNTGHMVAVMYNSSNDRFDTIDAVNMTEHLRVGN